MPAAEIVFAANPAQVLFGGDKDAVMHFLRAITSKTYTLQHGSEEWVTFITDLRKVTQIEVFKATIGDLESNPAQLVIYSILDIDDIITKAELPDSDNHEDLFFAKHFGEKEDALTILSDFSKNYKGLSPFINLYVTLCITSLDWVGSKVPVDDVHTKLNLAMYLQRSVHKNRLGARDQPADTQVLACILSLRLASQLGNEKRAETIQSIDRTMEAIKKFSGPAIIAVYFNEQS